MENIEIKYHDDELVKLDYIDGKSDWIDLRSAEDVVLKKGEFKLISLGVSMKLPKGYEAHIVPRSSTFKTWGIIQTNSVGVVDDTYIGDNDIWHLPVYCLQPNDEYEDILGTWVRKGDKIGQFRIMEVQPEFEFEEVDSFGNADRGGFGTTGTK